MILNLFDPELQLIITKPVTENKLKELFNEVERFKIQTTSVLDYKEWNYCKIFHLSARLINSDSDIGEGQNKK